MTASLISSCHPSVKKSVARFFSFFVLPNFDPSKKKHAAVLIQVGAYHAAATVVSAKAEHNSAIASNNNTPGSNKLP